MSTVFLPTWCATHCDTTNHIVLIWCYGNREKAKATGSYTENQRTFLLMVLQILISPRPFMSSLIVPLSYRFILDRCDFPPFHYSIHSPLNMFSLAMSLFKQPRTERSIACDVSMPCPKGWFFRQWPGIPYPVLLLQPTWAFAIVIWCISYYSILNL